MRFHIPHSTRTFVATILFSLGCLLSANAQTPKPPAPKPWWERMTFSGDVRGRYEGFFRSDQPARQRERFRLRVGLNAPISDEIVFVLRLASGDPLDPVSSNQSFGEFFSRKPLNIDQVAVTYAPKKLPALRFGVGKFAFPVRRTQVVWDDDLNFEGTYQQVTVVQRPRGTVRLTAVQSPMNEVSRGPDAFLFAFQGIGTMTIGSHSLDASLASYGFKEVDQVARAFAAGLIHSQNTNRVRRDASGAVTGFESGYHVIDAITSATLATARKPYPITLLFEWVHNTRASRSDTDSAVSLQASYGRAAQPGTYSVGYWFWRIEQDAVLSPFGFSDAPASNSSMHTFLASAMWIENVNVDVTLIRTRTLRTSEPWLNRLQVDARVRF